MNKTSDRICARCGNPADGYAQIKDDWYCHPDDESKPDCYGEAAADGYRDLMEVARLTYPRRVNPRRGGEGETPW